MFRGCPVVRGVSFHRMKSRRFGAVCAISLCALASLGLQCTQDVRIVGRERPAPTTAGGAATDAQGGAAGEAGDVGQPLGPFSAPRMVEELSDANADESEPTLTAGELEIHFSSTRIEQRKQIFAATRASKSERWGPPALVPELASAAGVSYSPEIAGNGLRIWFVSDRPGGTGDTDLYVAVRNALGEPWSSPQNVSELNTATCEIDPGPLAEHDQLVLTRCDSTGRNHLLLAQRSSPDALWQVVDPLTELNTVHKEGDPTFARGGLVLYLATTRESPNLDDRADIWRATRATLSAAFEPPSIVLGLNSREVDDQDPWVSDDERHIVFTSARDRWPRDIYEAFR